MKKKILAVFGIITITAAMLAGCSSKDVDANAEVSTEPVSVSDTTKLAESTTVSESTTTETTTKKEAAKTTTKAASKTTAAPKTTAKQTTKSTTAATTKAITQSTTKVTTTATTTTVKNVSAKDVQSQVNSYIRSKGITVDSSLNPSNSGWNVPISGMQEDLNNGYTLNECKYYVNNYIQNMGSQLSMYCYYSGDDFYVCYMMHLG